MAVIVRVSVQHAFSQAQLVLAGSRARIDTCERGSAAILGTRSTVRAWARLHARAHAGRIDGNVSRS